MGASHLPPEGAGSRVLQRRRGEGGRALVESVRGRIRNATIPYTIFSVLSVGRSIYRFYFSVHASLSSALLRLHVHCKLRHFSKIDYLYHRRLLWIVCNAVITG